MKNNKMKAHQKLRLLRLEKGFSIQEMCKESGLEFCAYYCIEVGLITPNPLQIGDICRALDAPDLENELIQKFIF